MKRLHELDRVANGGHVRDRIKDPVQEAMPAKGQQHTDERSSREETNHGPISRRIRTIFATQSLRHCPCSDQNHKYSGVLSRAGMAHKALMMLFPARLSAHYSPVLAAVWGVEAIAKNTWDKHANDFSFGQAPLRGEIPISLFAFFSRSAVSQ